MKDIRCHPSLLLIQILTRRIRSSLFVFFRHLGFADFPITTGFLLSPVAETKKATVNRSFDFLPPRLECVVRFSSWTIPIQHHSRSSIVKNCYASSHWKILFRTPLLQESSVSECYLLVFFHNRTSQQSCVLLSILCYFRILLRFENVSLKVIRSLLSALFYLLAWFNGVSNRTQPGVTTRLLQKTTCKLDMYRMYQLQLHKRFYIRCAFY